VREKRFGRDVFVYGFLYYSTYCRNMCNFCFYRRPNLKCRRYRKDPGYVAEVAQLLEESGAHVIDLTSGEDPITDDQKRFERIVQLVKLVRESVDMSIMVSPGVVPRSVLGSLKDSGADWYALYQETHNRCLFSNLRIGR
jgi:methylornithine synthase